MIIYYFYIAVCVVGVTWVLMKGKYLLSPVTIFIGSNLLYCIGLFFAKKTYQGTIYLPLLKNDEVLFDVTLTSLLGILGFLIFYLFNNDRAQIYIASSRYVVRTMPAYCILFPLAAILIILGPSYGWHAMTHDRIVEVSFATTLYAYIKYAFIVSSLLIISPNPFSKKMVLMLFILNVAVMLVDGARTTFLGFLIGYLFILYRSGLRMKFSHSALILIALFCIPAARAIVLDGNDFWGNFIAGISAEATMGGYTALQGVDATLHGGIMWGVSYVLDPIIYLLPREMREGNLYFFNHVFNYLYGENFSPLGGFFYISEAYSNFSIFGGFIIAGIYGYILRKFESCSGRFFYISLMFMATYGATFAKVNFANEFKIFITFLFFSFLFKKIILKKIPSL
ncbi:hypothetical protein J8628_18260 [Serratia fonticola]|uniref:hypothetical protein n=1 Tax=Serratia fonticola TaxID=47917 RepID=UPI001AE77855|nr:hypothetical protein [Serratia fonticola]MBP1018859.1 hypothetical protein [Serratia fonticola]